MGAIEGRKFWLKQEKVSISWKFQLFLIYKAFHIRRQKLEEEIKAIAEKFDSAEVNDLHREICEENERVSEML